jgi:hypothetical protein
MAIPDLEISNSKSDVSTRSSAISRMAENWPMIEALCAGTGAMRKAGITYLPRWPAEDIDAYKSRLKSAVLFPAFSRTTEVMASKPVSRDILVSKITPEVEATFEYFGGTGITLHAFASQLMLECMRPGLCGVLVDYPDVTDNITNLADEKASDNNPYCVIYKSKSILGWRVEKNKLTQVRLFECFCEPDGDFGETPVEQVRVLYPGYWEIYRKVLDKDNKLSWQVFSQGTTSLDVIPFVFFYGIYEDFGIGKPPLLDLAYLNIEHWQSSSDQQTILHVARVPILFARGLPDDQQLVIGSGSLTRTTAQTAELRYVEHSGAAIGAGRQSLVDLEDRMRQTGAELVVQKYVETTATQTSNDTEANRSILQRITEVFEESLEQCIDLMAKWLGQDIESEVDMHKDFNSTALSTQSAQILLEAEDKRVISKQTAFESLQRRDIIDHNITWEEEEERLEEQMEDEKENESENEDNSETETETETEDDLSNKPKPESKSSSSKSEEDQVVSNTNHS